MKVLKKRTCTFRPQPSVKAMLAECEALISSLEMETTLEDVINAALQSYLPALITSLRTKLKSSRSHETILKKAEQVIKGETIEKGFSDPD